MNYYGFRILFLLSTSNVIWSDLQSVKINLSDKVQIVLKASGERFNESHKLLVTGSGLSSEEEAYEVGKRIKNSLILCSSFLKMGIDVGKDKVKSWVFLDRFNNDDSELRYINEYHGLSVYLENKPIIVMSVSAELGPKGIPVERFTDTFLKAYSINPEFKSKELLAFELYNKAHFELSTQAKFITLITVIECLSTRQERPDYLKIYINQLIEQTKREIKDKDEQTSLARALDELKKQSIRSSCRELIKKYLGIEAVKQFDICYKIRNDIVHQRKIPAKLNIGKYGYELDEMVSQLILKSVFDSEK